MFNAIPLPQRGRMAYSWAAGAIAGLTLEPRSTFARWARLRGGTMKKTSLAIALAGLLALGASQTAGFAADLAVSEAAPRHIVTHRRVAKRVVAFRCIEVSQPPRGCPLRRYSLLPWPGIPRCYLYDGVCVYHTAPDVEQWAGY
jgi:hypothetical protein